MDFPISGIHVSPLLLMGLGFLIGILGGFFGVGGSFLAGPALFSVGMPMNMVVGTDLCHIVGKSIVAAHKHRTLGNVDLKLGMLMLLGTIAGVEVGAQGIQRLKQLGDVDTVLGVGFISILLSLSVFIGIDSWRTLRMRKRPSRQGKKDVTSFAGLSRWVQRLYLPPMISLPGSGIQQISLWAILTVSFVTGIFAGFFGGGGGYLRMPALVFLLGVPTHVAVGTDLFEIMISASYGTFSHGMKGNVDVLVALVMGTGAAIGAQIGATLTAYFEGPRLRLAFIPLPLIGAALLIYSLMTGHHFK